jgi:hypothetical protein
MRASLTLAELVRAGMPALLERYGSKLTAHQRRSLQDIIDCRSGAFGATLMCCSDCGEVQTRLRSCGNRCCPRCQHHAAEAWLERQRAKLLPVHYFMATFTLPAALRVLAYRHPEQVYPAFFCAVAETLKLFASNHSQLHADIGFCAVLHTHSRRLDYHPHLHLIIPGGGVERTGDGTALWHILEQRYLFNGFALARVFRAKCLAALQRTGLMLPAALPKKWVVHCQHVGSGLSALQYLSRYLYRGVLSERDLVAFDDIHHTVTFRYRHAKSRCYQRRTLDLADFLWHIAMHILPKGLQRVRSFGFLHGNARRVLRLVQLVLRIAPPAPEPRTPKPFHCQHCGSQMRVGVFVPPLPMPLPSG